MTTKEFDHEVLSSLNLQVETLASNGFTQETAFTVAVTDVGGASAWVPSLEQPVYAGDASLETAQHMTLPAAMLFLGLILLAAARQRRAMVRYIALVLLGTTLLVTCGCLLLQLIADACVFRARKVERNEVIDVHDVHVGVALQQQLYSLGLAVLDSPV